MTLARRLLGGVLLLALVLQTSGAVAAPTEADLGSAEARLLEIERDFELVVEEYNAVNERLQQIQYDMAAKQLVVRDVERRMATKEEAAVALATELYMSGPTGMAVESVLSSESLSEIETRVAYLRSSNEAQARLFSELARERGELNVHLGSLEKKKAEVLAAEIRLDRLRAEVELKLVEQQDEIQRLNTALERARVRAVQAATITAAQLPDLGPIRPAPAPNPKAQAAVDAALAELGKPYVWAAEGPDSFDCSGLTLWAWAKAGVELPHNSGMQYAATTRVPARDWEPGDLLFFGSPIHHVGMYIGNGQMVEAPYTGSEVRVVSAYRTDYVGAGRPGV
jgi:peptidoglycan DL-endopeptidase CwlO